ncbi:hypothetical protein HKX48_003958 [Thoreauomyces humboldtii]|nr:hypothetical protein HKX48_003958 [Thoreauomyces humboldtii]
MRPIYGTTNTPSSHASNVNVKDKANTVSNVTAPDGEHSLSSPSLRPGRQGTATPSPGGSPALARKWPPPSVSTSSVSSSAAALPTPASSRPAGSKSADQSTAPPPPVVRPRPPPSTSPAAQRRSEASGLTAEGHRRSKNPFDVDEPIASEQSSPPPPPRPKRSTPPLPPRPSSTASIPLPPRPTSKNPFLSGTDDVGSVPTQSVPSPPRPARPAPPTNRKSNPFWPEDGQDQQHGQHVARKVEKKQSDPDVRPPPPPPRLPSRPSLVEASNTERSAPTPTATPPLPTRPATVALPYPQASEAQVSVLEPFNRKQYPRLGRVRNSSASKYTLIDFSHIDAHASAPIAKEMYDVDQIASYLTEPYPDSELHRLRSIFVWIATNIAYDVQLFKNLASASGSRSIHDTLNLRLAVCQGYAELFKALADRCRLPTCRVVGGLATGFGYEPGHTLADRKRLGAGHAWNVVLVDGEWRGLDSCWAAGVLNPGFTWIFNPYWFLTDPGEFVFSHFPDKEEDQCLGDAIVSSQEWDRLVKVDTEFWESGVVLASYTDAGGLMVPHEGWTPDTDLIVRLIVPDGWKITAGLVRKADGATVEKATFNEWTLPDDEAEDMDPGTLECRIRVRPPAPGYYAVKVFARHDSSTEESYPHLLTLALSIPSTVPYPTTPIPLFPTDYTGGQPSRLSLRSPLRSPIPANSTVRFVLAHMEPGSADGRLSVSPHGEWAEKVDMRWDPIRRTSEREVNVGRAGRKWVVCRDMEGGAFAFVAEWDVV